MPNQYEQLMKAVAERANQDKRAQPWTQSFDALATAPTEEWIQVDDASDASDSETETIDVRTNAFP